MNKSLFPLLVCLLISSISFSQTKNDKLFLTDETKEVKIKEVGPDFIKYTFPGEEVLYTISKNVVNKIEFSSGRIEEFTTPFKEINSILDIEKVFITFNPDDVQGLDMKGDLFSKAVGVTTLSSVNNVNNRALTKLKTEAFMMGANALFIGNQFQRGNQYGNENTPGNSTMTTYSAKAYSSKKLDIVAAKEMIENHKFNYYQRLELSRNDWSPNLVFQESWDKDYFPILDELGEVSEKDGVLFVKLNSKKLGDKKLQVVRIGEDQLTLMDRTDKKIINYDFLTDQHKQVQNRIKMAQLRKENENGQ
ncbi:hypothetical protein FHS59_004379 [Algoriphagus iocasae]|uniref:Uncharacterized protein n=1 Tax=Algoriphagus iocasae TaxID=1836499 RepID=A0A841MMM0_9BACT|nr:hypothetical protein [Algoriphagus iocasae]MBB6328720.1 hypothetical protein [Algoriphagus iocasae]